MFLATQLIGLAVIHAYSPINLQQINSDGEVTNVTYYNLPYGMEPPVEKSNSANLTSIFIAFIIAIAFILILMKFKIEILFRFWFFFVVTIALAITFNAALSKLEYASIIAILIALPLTYIKVFKRDILVHNFTELLIYPGIAVIFVPLLSVWTVSLLLIVFSIYDIYAVWHSGFMQKMAKYQINVVRVFSGFFIPYIGKKEREKLVKLKRKGNVSKIKMSVAILGGGDIIFPIIMAGVVAFAFSFYLALLISLGAAISLSILLYLSEKGKFYPALPFISAGCFAGLGLVYLIG